MRNSICARKHCKIDSRVYLWKSANLHSEITLNPFFLFRFNVITCIGIDLLYNFCELIHLATFQRCVKNKRRCVKIEMWFFYPRRVFYSAKPLFNERVWLRFCFYGLVTSASFETKFADNWFLLPRSLYILNIGTCFFSTIVHFCFLF